MTTKVTINSNQYEYWWNDYAKRYFITVSNTKSCAISKRKLVQGENRLVDNVTAIVDYQAKTVDINERNKVDATAVGVCDTGESLI